MVSIELVGSDVVVELEEFETGNGTYCPVIGSYCRFRIMCGDSIGDASLDCRLRATEALFIGYVDAVGYADEGLLTHDDEESV